MNFFYPKLHKGSIWEKDFSLLVCRTDGQAQAGLFAPTEALYVALSLLVIPWDTCNFLNFHSG